MCDAIEKSPIDDTKEINKNEIRNNNLYSRHFLKMHIKLKESKKHEMLTEYEQRSMFLLATGERNHVHIFVMDGWMAGVVRFHRSEN